jgi:hypothetical protein
VACEGIVGKARRRSTHHRATWRFSCNVKSLDSGMIREQQVVYDDILKLVQLDVVAKYFRRRWICFECMNPCLRIGENAGYTPAESTPSRP